MIERRKNVRKEDLMRDVRCERSGRGGRGQGLIRDGAKIPDDQPNSKKERRIFFPPLQMI